METSQYPAGPARVLIVDDDPVNLLLLSQILISGGFSVQTAPDGETALAEAQRAQPELVLLDVCMPGLDGYEVCARLKTDLVTRDIPVIFLTARTDPNDVVRGFEAGAADYVTKPFQEAELMARVRTHVALRRALEAERAARNKERQLVAELQKAIEAVKRLSGLIPICAQCKKVRKDDGYWEQVEKFISEHSEAMFTHSICPACIEKLYPNFKERKARPGPTEDF